VKKYLTIVLGLVVIVLVAYQGLIYLDNNFRYGRMWETPSIRPHEQELLQMDEGLVPIGGGEALMRATPGEKLKPPFSMGSLTTIEIGEQLYFTSCAPCHGHYHDGNGTVGQSFPPLAAGLRSTKVQNQLEGIIFKEISYGVRDGRQPPLATTIRIDDRWRIIAYVKSLGPRK
jgi:mono/diheme cytochrome c family protein